MKRLSVISIVLLGGCASILVNSKIVDVPLPRTEPTKPISQAAEPLRAPPVVSKPVVPVSNTPQPKPIPVAPQGKQDTSSQTIDKRCDVVSGYARAVAGLRDSGIRRDELPLPPASSFPMRVLQDDVYARDDISPDQMRTRYTDFCVKHGFDNMLQVVEADNVRRPEEPTIQKNSKNSILVPINKDQPVTDPVTP